MFKKALNNDKLDVKAYALKNPSIASMMTMSEEGRRMQEMMKMYAMYGMDSSMFEQNSLSLILNTNHPLVQKLQSLPEGDLSTKICEQLYDLAMISHAPLEADRMTKFIERSNELMLMLSEK